MDWGRKKKGLLQRILTWSAADAGEGGWVSCAPACLVLGNDRLAWIWVPGVSRGEREVRDGRKDDGKKGTGELKEAD